MVVRNLHILGGCPPFLRFIMMIFMAGVIFTEPEDTVDVDVDADAGADANVELKNKAAL